MTNSMNTSHNYVKLFFSNVIRIHRKWESHFRQDQRHLTCSPHLNTRWVQFLQGKMYLLGITELERFQRWLLPAVPFHFLFLFFLIICFFLLLCLTACIIKACLDIPFLPYRKCISRNHINLIILGLLPTSMNTWHSAWVAACIGIELCTSSGEQFHIRSLSHNLVKTKCAFSDQIKT